MNKNNGVGKVQNLSSHPTIAKNKKDGLFNKVVGNFKNKRGTSFPWRS